VVPPPAESRGVAFFMPRAGKNCARRHRGCYDIAYRLL
jgi:hypothetical protein